MIRVIYTKIHVSIDGKVICENVYNYEKRVRSRETSNEKWQSWNRQ